VLVAFFWVSGFHIYIKDSSKKYNPHQLLSGLCKALSRAAAGGEKVAVGHSPLAVQNKWHRESKRMGDRSEKWIQNKKVLLSLIPFFSFSQFLRSGFFTPFFPNVYHVSVITPRTTTERLARDHDQNEGGDAARVPRPRGERRPRPRGGGGPVRGGGSQMSRRNLR
jgi:hypothetical protein